MTIKVNTDELVDILIALEMRADYVSPIDATKQERLKKMIEKLKETLENQYHLPSEDKYEPLYKDLRTKKEEQKQQ